MLVIRRRTGEAIRIGDGIEIRILEAGPNRVKLGVSAPAEVPVMREEVALAREQNRAAANPKLAALEAFALGLRQSK